MRYRAVLYDPGDKSADRQKQEMANSRKQIDEWTSGVLAAAVSPDASVSIYETSERLIDLKLKPKSESAK